MPRKNKEEFDSEPIESDKEKVNVEKSFPKKVVSGKVVLVTRGYIVVEVDGTNRHVFTNKHYSVGDKYVVDE